MGIDTIKTNVFGCKNLLECIVLAGNKPRVMIASSSSVYGDSNKPKQTETDTLNIKSTEEGLWIYINSKIMNESIAFAFGRQYQLPITIMRIFNTIGPKQTGMYGMVVPRFVEEACTEADITVYGDGEQTRSFCDVRDITKIIVALAENYKCIGEIINVGSDHEISINDLSSLVKKLAKSSSNIVHSTYDNAYGHKFTDILTRRPNLSKLEKFVTFKPEWTLEQTILDLIKLFRQPRT